MMVDLERQINFVYEEWLEENLQAEADSISENWVPAIQLVSFNKAGQALAFSNLRLRLTTAMHENEIQDRCA